MTSIAGHQPKTLPAISAGADEMLSYMHQQIQRAVADASSQMKRLQQSNAELEGELQAARGSTHKALIEGYAYRHELTRATADVDAMKSVLTALGMQYSSDATTGERVLTCYEAWRSHLGSNIPGVHLNFIDPQPVPGPAASEAPQSQSRAEPPPPPIYAEQQHSIFREQQLPVCVSPADTISH
ncbi:hypothetical protein BDZ89DRAFT_1059453 [Hymenopellis radicata]|nr:hypothetical protein BDZ89DRAFT_1059453 [Hymenopellis radicata]